MKRRQLRLLETIRRSSTRDLTSRHGHTCPSFPRSFTKSPQLQRTLPGSTLMAPLNPASQVCVTILLCLAFFAWMVSGFRRGLMLDLLLLLVLADIRWETCLHCDGVE
jgi:hypothetical protein